MSHHLTHRFPIFSHRPTCSVDLHSGNQYKRGHGNEQVGANSLPPSLPPQQQRRPSGLLISWEARRGPQSCRTAAHAPDDLNQMHNGGGCLHRAFLPAGWTAIKSLGNSTSAQLDGCTFVSGLLASDRDDMKAGQGGAGLLRR